MKRFIIVGIMLITIHSLYSCEEPTIPVTGIILNSETLNLTEGEEFKLTATISPSNATDKTIVWSSSNATVASVFDGNVTAIKEGFATISAISLNDGIKATCSVTVKARSIDVESITLSLTEAIMNVGDNIILNAVIKPDNATDKNIIWNSSNESIATVDQNGKVTAVGGGNAIITAKAGNITAICSILVNGFRKFLTFTSEGTTTISLINTDPETPLLYYSTDTNNWRQWDYSNLTFSSSSPLYICGDNPDRFSLGDGEPGYSRFVATGDYFCVSGDIMSLIDKDRDVNVVPNSFCFNHLFENCILLRQAPELTATILTPYCYLGMFKGCTNLTSAPELPATSLAEGCYSEMFRYCTSLTSTPILPATSLAPDCYSLMFADCSNITKSLGLPATVLESNCYSGMFGNCTSLSSFQELPATTLAEWCYSDMFNGCVKLIEAPELPATQLARGCYAYMFAGCESLFAPPVLPATTLAPSCYADMFTDCISLTEAPDLRAEILVDGCYRGMFDNCHNLSYVKCLAVDISDTNCVSDWMLNVAPMGTFIKAANMNDWPTGVSGIPDGWEVRIDISVNKYLSFTSEGMTTISLENYGGNAPLVYYSSDATNWYEWDYSALSFSRDVPLYLCGDNPDGFSMDIEKYSSFVATGSDFRVSGDLMSLVNKIEDVDVIPCAGCFAYLFCGCTALIQAPELPAATLKPECYWCLFSGCSLSVAPDLPAKSLASGCYTAMFRECTSLNVAPKLPATILAPYCYQHMFMGCTSLIEAPDLPATSLTDGCYIQMFWNCKNLNSAPALPATKLADKCYVLMFMGCESLTVAPALPATSLSYSCYSNMFASCTGLSVAPELPATELASECYDSMFSGCTSLINAPELPATTLAPNCYQSMFSGCTRLKVAPKLPATNLTVYCYCGMFMDCSSLISAPVLPSILLAPYCYAAMFSRCTNLIDAPALPASSLVSDCYSQMFYGCTSLTTAPELRATSLTRNCYSQMFSGCSSLNFVQCLATDLSASLCLEKWMDGVASTGVFEKATSANWPSGISGIPSGWTVVEAE